MSHNYRIREKSSLLRLATVLEITVCSCASFCIKEDMIIIPPSASLRKSHNMQWKSSHFFQSISNIGPAAWGWIFEGG